MNLIQWINALHDNLRSDGLNHPEHLVGRRDATKV